MGRTEKAEELRDKLIEALAAKGAAVADMAEFARCIDVPQLRSILQRWARSGRELFFVKGVGFISVHVRSEAPGFWGVTKDVVSDFETVRNYLGIPCWYVLLVGRKDGKDVNGYILEQLQGPPLVQNPSEQSASYKINERDIDVNIKVGTAEFIARKLIEHGKAKFPQLATER
jgi:hypothetical protein